MYMGVCLFQVIICKHLSNVCAALWSLAENALANMHIHTTLFHCILIGVSLLVFCIVCC